MTDIGRFRESYNLATANPILQDPSMPVTEAAVGDIQIKNLAAIFPAIRATTADKLTLNSTFYPWETLVGRKHNMTPTGYSSWVIPHPKPVITEHNAQGDLFTPAATPLGRVIYSACKKNAPEEMIEAAKGIPGYLKGSGYMQQIFCISDPEAIPKVLGGAYHTVSIGGRAGKIIESISGLDLVKCRQLGKELPPYQKGWNEVDGKSKYSYWSMFDLAGMETSYVNVPADTLGFTLDPDIGRDGVRLLVGEKVVGVKEYAFYDAASLEKVLHLSDLEYAAWANMDFVDSITLPKYHMLGGIPSLQPKEGEYIEDISGRKGLVLSINGEVVTARKSVEGKTTPHIFTTKLKDVKPSEFAFKESFDGDVNKNKEEENKELREFFLKNFNEDLLDKNSKNAVPLLALRNSENWISSHYLWARDFKTAFESKDNSLSGDWGIPAAETPKDTTSVIVNTIAKVLKNG